MLLEEGTNIVNFLIAVLMSTAASVSTFMSYSPTVSGDARSSVCVCSHMTESGNLHNLSSSSFDS